MDNRGHLFAKQHPTPLRVTIEDVMRRASVGDVVTWEQLEEACDTPRTGLYMAVKLAKARLEREGYKFIVRPGIGNERLDDNAVVAEVLPKLSRSLHRIGKKIVRTAESVDVLKVSVENRPTLVGAAALGALAVASSQPKAIKAIGEQRMTTTVLQESLKSLTKDR